MNRMRVSLRFYLPDFIENLNTNIEELERIYAKNMAPITLYLWYDTKDKTDFSQWNPSFPAKVTLASD